MVPLAKESKEIVPRVPFGDDLVADVRTIETGNEHPRLLEPQVLEDLPPGKVVGGGRQRDSRDAGKPFSEDVELSVLGTEVMSPLAHAVGLVDGEESDSGLPEKLEKGGHREPLRSHVQKIDSSLDDIRFDPPGIASRKARVQIRRPHSELAERVDLVLHEGDEGRDHHADTFSSEGRDLVAEALAAARGHQNERVPARGDVLDYRLLVSAEVRIPEDRPQNFLEIHHGNETKFVPGILLQIALPLPLAIVDCPSSSPQRSSSSIDPAPR
jgi:hypothetical protein